MYKELLRLKKNEEMVRLTCQEKKVDAKAEDTICKTIHCESGFDDKAVCDNGTSKDFGIAQWNNYWAWKREKIISPEDALYNPKLSMEKMLDIFKEYGYTKNGLGRWVCYSSGKFRRFTGKI